MPASIRSCRWSCVSWSEVEGVVPGRRIVEGMTVVDGGLPGREGRLLAAALHDSDILPASDR